MPIVEDVIYTLINGKRTITKPIFIKDFTKENQQLNALVELSKKVKTPAKKELIDRDIAYLKYGLDGEANVYYEIKNSFVPMLCLHDIRLEYEDYIAQLDFTIITNKFIYVLETKKLNGNIEITSDGDFIRTVSNKYGKIIKKEGMYSPISQNDRHVRILKDILMKEDLIRTMLVKSAVIIANPKTIVSKQHCPAKIKNNIYKYDQITNLLKREMDDKTNEKDLLEKYLYAIADYMVKYNKPLKIDYEKKYSLTKEDFTENDSFVKVEPTNQSVDSELYLALKKYRLETSKKDNIKAYVVFNNEQLDSLMNDKPETLEELLKVKGFGQWRVEKYGRDIVQIINEHNN